MIITIDEKDLKRMINESVEERLKQAKEPTYCREWLKLRKEIDEYCHSTKYQENNRSYATLQNFIYSAIKFALGISRLSEMTNVEAEVAREVFEFLKEKRGQAKWMS
ncbi:hypothetical protein [Ligilactobacillus apodemi]|uniref:Uncharacterized protein n=1 Tax=Ligilactobacillus apodemi DSM 16634 = JCM 16172 TaxID=1423724 RepID=A0A0R1TRI8_9LACO|nr:hypothetical protein [Ligilactobacillus apodemi]KRL84029.1 hypothetical protein FC32_GL001305 [Ligilactobacillus apodemi DSM 16634 = JCM 16172]MCR1900906.1 hypothetical protein [Ligilactobacillus apodemi]